MIGDGMGPQQEEAARRYLDGPLVWDSFPYQGTLVTNNYFGEVTDSAAAATALSTGVKTYNGSIKRDTEGNELKSIMEYAQEAGKRTGVITSKFLFDATPAAFSANAASRQHHDIIKVSQIESGIDLLIGEAGSGYDYYSTQIAEAGYRYITDAAVLNDYSDAEKIWAPLSSIVPDAESEGQTELAALAEFALDFLENEEGFVLMIEGGKIDDKCHQNDIEGAIAELLAFENTVKKVLDWAEDRDDTVIIVTADHEMGGLTVNPDADAANILEGAHIDWSTDGHTGTPVNYHAYGAFGKNVKKLFDEILLPECYNTEIFNICKALLN